MWASLLASAVDPSGPKLSYFGFADVLRQLTPDEANLLERIYDPKRWLMDVEELLDLRNETIPGATDVIFGNLCRLLLLAPWHKVMDPAEIEEAISRPFESLGPVVSEDVTGWHRTDYGSAFMDACRRPAEKLEQPPEEE